MVEEARTVQELYWLSDEEWARIEPLLPPRRRGAQRVDDRRVISGVVHMLKVGGRWRDCPEEYGPHTTIYNRFNRWSKRGAWENIFHALGGSISVDSTAMRSRQAKAHRSASGAEGAVHQCHQRFTRQSDDPDSPPDG